MRIFIVSALLVLAAVWAGCVADQTPSTTLVKQAGFAPYYTSIDDALKAAKDDQYVVLEFYTDW